MLIYVVTAIGYMTIIIISRLNIFKKKTNPYSGRDSQCYVINKIFYILYDIISSADTIITLLFIIAQMCDKINYCYFFVQYTTIKEYVITYLHIF